MKKGELMRAGMMLFSEKGYHDTKVSDIVKEAGVAQGTFYLYFESKADLFAALLDKFIALITEAVGSIVFDLHAISTPVQLGARLRLAVETILMVYRDNVALAQIVTREGSSLGADSADRWHQALDRIAEIGAQVMDVAIEQGLLPRQNSKVVPYCVLGMYERSAYRWLIEDKSMDVDELAEALTRFEMLGISGQGSIEMEAAITGELSWEQAMSQEST